MRGPVFESSRCALVPSLDNSAILSQRRLSASESRAPVSVSRRRNRHVPGVFALVAVEKTRDGAASWCLRLAFLWNAVGFRHGLPCSLDTAVPIVFKNSLAVSDISLLIGRRAAV